MEITWEKVLAFFAGIVTIGGGGAVIKKWIAPAIKYNIRLCEAEERIRQNIKNENDIQQCQQLLLKGMLALLESELSGVDKEKLTIVKDQVQEYLIER